MSEHHCHPSCTSVLLCDTIPGKMRPRVHSLLIGNRRLKYGYTQSPAWWTNPFIGVSYRRMSKGLLAGTDMSQRQLQQKFTPAWVTADQPAGCLTGWGLSFPGSWADLYPFQADCLVWECPLAVLTTYISLGGEGIISFRDFLQLLSCVLPEF